MIQERTVLYLNPFYFNNGNAPSPKYCLVIKAEDKVFLANLPSSNNIVPYGDVNVKHGCISMDDINFHCFCLLKNTPYTDSQYCFPLNTFLYGKWVDEFDLGLWMETYNTHDSYTNCGKVSHELYAEILNCLIKSRETKRGLKRKIEDILKN